MAAECVTSGSVSARPRSIAIVLRIVMAAVAMLSIVGCWAVNLAELAGQLRFVAADPVARRRAPCVDTEEGIVAPVVMLSGDPLTARRSRSCLSPLAELACAEQMII